MTKTIAFYISNHGFGHASRNIPIIDSLLTKSGDIKVIVKSGKKQIRFMKRLLEKFSPKVVFYEEDVDVGLLLQAGKIEVDKAKLECELEKFIASWDYRIRNESNFLINHTVDLVISDIVPWVFPCCREQGIQSILLSNFTWVEIYKELFPGKIYQAYLQHYKQADEAWLYPLHGDITDYMDHPKYVGLSCRKFNDENVQSIRNAHRQPIVFVSVGRSVDLKEVIDVEELPYDFIYTEGMNLSGENAYKLPSDTLNTQDYIKAADYVITKAGWGTIAEAMCAKKPMLVLERNEIAEDRATLAKLMQLGVAIAIKPDGFTKANINSLLETAQEQKLASKYHNLADIYSNAAENIANDLLKHVL